MRLSTLTGPLYGGLSLALCTAIVAAAPVVAQEKAQEKAIDTQRSTITIHVGKSGLLSAAAHDHTVNAPISSGTILESGTQHVEFRVETAKMTVKPDPKIDATDQATIQTHMEEMTLETKKFPEITFRSSRIEKLADGQWKVDGDLSLHGVTKPVSLTVKQDRRFLDDPHRSQADGFWNQAHQYWWRNDQGEERSGDRLSNLRAAMKAVLLFVGLSVSSVLTAQVNPPDRVGYAASRGSTLRVTRFKSPVK